MQKWNTETKKTNTWRDKDQVRVGGAEQETELIDQVKIRELIIKMTKCGKLHIN